MNTLLLGNCLDQLRTQPDSSIDSIVTDPPYGLSFMSKAWDYSVPSTEIWKECLRVLKPGGHLLAFGGTRTYHRLVVNIEDAGFEIRDQIMWIYGSGFPKSMDISKAIDGLLTTGKSDSLALKEVNKSRPGEVTVRPQSQNGHAGFVGSGDVGPSEKRNTPATEDAKKWSGYGTALKPANEPICLARKPLSEKTVAKNVLKHGVGGLNVDASRIGYGQGESAKDLARSSQGFTAKSETFHNDEKYKTSCESGNVAGRFPANILFDEAAAAVLDEQSGVPKSQPRRISATENPIIGNNGIYSETGRRKESEHADSGGASRFFYVAKASKKDRNTGLPTGFATWENLDQNRVDQTAKLSAQLKATLDDMTLPADDSEWNMCLYGNRTPDNQSQQVLTSTTLMRLKTIIESKTLNVLASLTTKESIQDVLETMKASGLSLVESAALLNDLSLSTISDEMESLLGVVAAVLKTLSPIRKLDGNSHSTVKPIKLMEYLIKLVTPEGGTVLDPFMGSGTTGVAAQNTNFKFVGIELDESYFQIAKGRIEK